MINLPVICAAWADEGETNQLKQLYFLNQHILGFGIALTWNLWTLSC